MYGGNESNNNSTLSSSNNLVNKETLLTPHIASHKSLTNLVPAHTAQIVVTSTTSNTNPPAVQQTHRVTNSVASHVPTYRVANQSHQTVLKNVDHEVPVQRSYTNLVKLTAQDLSAHTTDKNCSTVEVDSVELQGNVSQASHKTLPEIHTVVSASQLSDRLTSYYRVHDANSAVAIPVHQSGGTIAIINQPSNSVSLEHQSPMTSELDLSNAHATTLTSTSNLQTTRQSMPNTSYCCALSQVPMPSTITSQSTILNIPENMLLQEVPGGVGEGLKQDCHHQSVVVETDNRNHNKDMKLSNNTSGSQKDLVRQALQAAVTQNPSKGHTSNMMEYNYSTGEITADSDECIGSDEIILPHTAFCNTGIAIPRQELLMMNIQVNSSVPGATKSATTTTGNGTNVIMLQPAVVEDNTVTSPSQQPKQRRRSRLTEEAEASRRDVIASRMRQKRANETEEQKVTRRLREAERMKKKRACESLDQKMRRRSEAALRARLRRANMSPEERCKDRKKAAERMRLRRRNESDEQKAARRMKAAERMRKRRACETPEQRAVRRQSIAMRMKAKRKRKEDKVVAEPPPLSPGTLVRGPRIIQVTSEYPQSPTERESNQSLDYQQRVQNPQIPNQASHIVVSSNVNGNVALVNVDPSMLHGNILSSVELASLASIPVNIKQPSQDGYIEIVNVKEESGRISPNNSNRSVSAHVLLPSISHISSVPTEPLSLQKTSMAATPIVQSSTSHLQHSNNVHHHHHHLPHILQSQPQTTSQLQDHHTPQEHKYPSTQHHRHQTPH